jgi:prefoldin subunit 5
MPSPQELENQLEQVRRQLAVLQADHKNLQKKFDVMRDELRLTIDSMESAGVQFARVLQDCNKVQTQVFHRMAVQRDHAKRIVSMVR